jgi:hypothetical protein
MKIVNRIILVLFIGFGFSSFIVHASQPESPSETLSYAIDQIRSERSIIKRTALAEDLANLARNIPKTAFIDDKAILNITLLLNDKDDSVRYWSALALGNLGPRATLALPELKIAFDEAVKEEKHSFLASGVKLSDGARVAIKEISGEAP